MATPAERSAEPIPATIPVESLGNTAACNIQSPAVPRDTKSNDAAAQAIQLGSQGSWSDAFSPRFYPSTMTQMENNHADEQEYNEDDGIEAPPPTYANATRPQELPASPVIVAPQAVSHTSMDAQPDMYGPRSVPASLYEPGPGESSPLLGHSTLGDTPSSWWQSEPKQSRRKLFCFAALVSAIVSIVIGAVLGTVLWQHGSLPSAPTTTFIPIPSATFIPTDRVYERHETTRDINGKYKLYDKLDLSTTTGSINIEIDPQPGNEPAVLFLASDLGSIVLHLSASWKASKSRPARPVYAEIRSFTGTITAETPLGFGGRVLVHTTTGEQFISIFAHGVSLNDPISNISTTSGTGNQRIQMYQLSRTSISSVRAEHHNSASGNVEVVYPDNWLGRVRASATLGTVTVRGEDLMYEQNSEHNVVARRGRDIDDNEVVVMSGTGQASFRC